MAVMEQGNGGWKQQSVVGSRVLHREHSAGWSGAGRYIRNSTAPHYSSPHHRAHDSPPNNAFATFFIILLFVFILTLASVALGLLKRWVKFLFCVRADGASPLQSLWCWRRRGAGEEGVASEVPVVKEEDTKETRRAKLEAILSHCTKIVEESDIILDEPQPQIKPNLSNDATDSQTTPSQDTEHEPHTDNQDNNEEPDPSLEVTINLYQTEEESGHLLLHHPNRLTPNCCAICLSPYTPGEAVTWSNNPQCPHVFHNECILLWLVRLKAKKSESNTAACPCCRRQFALEDTQEHQHQKEKVVLVHDRTDRDRTASGDSFGGRTALTLSTVSSLLRTSSSGFEDEEEDLEVGRISLSSSLLEEEEVDLEENEGHGHGHGRGDEDDEEEVDGESSLHNHEDGSASTDHNDSNETSAENAIQQDHSDETDANSDNNDPHERQAAEEEVLHPSMLQGGPFSEVVGPLVHSSLEGSHTERSEIQEDVEIDADVGEDAVIDANVHEDVDVDINVDVDVDADVEAAYNHTPLSSNEEDTMDPRNRNEPTVSIIRSVTLVVGE